jgi:hypothetical protein
MSFISEQNRELLQPIADQLIPSYNGKPSASQAEVVTRWAEEVLGLRHDLREPFFRALRLLKESASANSRDSLNELQKQDREAFNALGTVLAGGYFLNPDVRGKIGYPGQTTRDYQAEETPDYVMEGLLEPVIKRGPIYRVP